MSRIARLRAQPSRAVVRRAAGHRPPAPKVIRIAPRSATADAMARELGHLAFVDEDVRTDGSAGAGRLQGIRRRLAALAAAVLVVAVAALAAGGTRVVLATFTDQAAVAGTFSTGTWGAPTTWYLHNDPTPPTGNTPARALLAMDANAPAASTLYNYDTDCDKRAGRAVDPGSGSVDEAAACSVATWQSAPLAQARTMSGTATLAIWARKSRSGGANPTLRAYLRVLDPTGAYTELGSANGTVVPNARQAWARLTLTWTLTGVSVPAGSIVEVKVVTLGGTRDPEIAYDTTAYPSALTLP